MRKHEQLFERESIKSISFLFNNAYEVENCIVAGTRGWYSDEDAKNAPDNADFDKLIRRECLRLKASLDEAKKIKEISPEKEIIVFMHFPPVWNGKRADELIAVLKEYDITHLYFGHIHGSYCVEPSFEYDGIKMSLISADFIEFTPKIIKV